MIQNIDYDCRVDDVFSSIDMLFLGISNRTVRAEGLRKQMNSLSILHQHYTEAEKLSFRFSHIDAFMSGLISKFCEHPKDPFSFVWSSRPAGYTNSEFASHLSELLRISPSEAWLWHFLAPLVGAAIFLSSYPPGSHRTFQSCLLNTVIYLLT